VDFNSIAAIIGVVSGVVGIIGYFLPVRSTHARKVYAAYIFAVTLAVGFGTYEATRLARLNDIGMQVQRLYLSLNNGAYGPEENVSMIMTFLEKNKDIFPDAYKRASDDYEAIMKGPHRRQDVQDLEKRLSAIAGSESSLSQQ
jgi:hypothetical protein